MEDSHPYGDAVIPGSGEDKDDEPAEEEPDGSSQDENDHTAETSEEDDS